MKNKIIYWLLSISVALPFTMFGLMKIMGAEEMMNNMAQIHYDPMITRLIGLVEILAVIGLFITKFRVGSLVILLLILAGAVGSHIGEGQDVGAVVIPSTISFLVAITLIVEIGNRDWKIG